MGHQYCFELTLPEEADASASVKAAKIKSGKLVQGRHTTYRICAADQASTEAAAARTLRTTGLSVARWQASMESWMHAIEAAMTKDPLTELYRSKCERLRRPSQGRTATT